MAELDERVGDQLSLVTHVYQLGINITPMVAAIGGLTVGLSLALRGPVSNYGAGAIGVTYAADIERAISTVKELLIAQPDVSDVLLT